jgi:putative ABC transport system permease protein
MLYTFLKIAIRNSLRQKLYTSLNVFGLALGLAAALIIGIFANHELTYDQFHDNSESIFMAYKERITPNGVQATYDTWAPMGQRFVDEYPEVINAVRFVNDDAIFEVNNERFEGSLSYSDLALFEMFDFELKLGNTDNAFPTDNAIILSEAAAIRYFGDANPLGQVIRIDLDRSYQVTGVLKSIPTNSSIQIEHLISLSTLPEYAEFENSWGGSFLNTYIQLDDAGKATDLASKFPDLITNIWDEEVTSRTNFKLLPLKDVYSTIIGDIQIAYILLYIAVGILLISCINFINLYTSSTLSRSKEIGVKKVVGSTKAQLLTQFLGEALLVVIVSTTIAVATTTLFMPLINDQFDVLLSVPIANPTFYLILVGLVAMIGLLSGGYPAYIMSKFGIISSLKKATTTGKGRRPLDFMIAFQFFVSILLIVGTLVVNKQIDFLQNTSMGFDKEDLVVIPLSLRDFAENDSSSTVRVESFKNEIAALSDVVSTTTSRHIPTDWTGSFLFVRPDGWTESPLRMAYTYHDANFFDTYGIEVTHGRNFNEDATGAQRGSVVLNKAAMEAFGFEDIENQVLRIGKNQINVVGVIDDFNFESMRDNVRPILHFHRTPSNRTHNYLTLKTSPGTANNVLALVEDKWDMLASDIPFEYLFINENVERMYEAENRLLLMSSIFSGVAILVACLGLFGIVSYHVEKRKKEIGIRKVLGATAYSIVTLISKRFTMLVLIGFVISLPVGIHYLNEWLSGFAYHIEISPLLFLFTLLVVLAAALLTIGVKTIQAGLSNPVDVLNED